MTDEQLLHLFYAYYAVGAICGGIWLALRILGRVHVLRHHPELLPQVPPWNSVFRDAASQFLAWPLFTPNLVAQISLQLKTCSHRKKP